MTNLAGLINLKSVVTSEMCSYFGKLFYYENIGKQINLLKPNLVYAVFQEPKQFYLWQKSNRLLACSENTTEYSVV